MGVMRNIGAFCGMMALALTLFGSSCKGEERAAPLDPTTKLADIRPGMNEADLLKLLGPSYSSREQPPSLKMLYFSKPLRLVKKGRQIMEIQVLLENGVVKEAKPVWGSKD